jgi:hypothetical protein
MKDMNNALSNEVINWGREIIPVTISGRAYTASAGAICADCRAMFGAVTTSTLERYGVTSEIHQVCLAFWAHNYSHLCGDWSDIPCAAA